MSVTARNNAGSRARLGGAFAGLLLLGALIAPGISSVVAQTSEPERQTESAPARALNQAPSLPQTRASGTTEPGRPPAEASEAVSTDDDALPEAVNITQTLSGQVRLVDEQGRPVTADVDLSEAVVYFKADAPSEWIASAEEITLTTQRRRFVPRVIVVEAGSVVRFPNADPILHNVFSSSPGNRFDLGLYGRSDGETHQFNDPGLVRVFCNVHPAMSAHVVVVDTPHYVRPDASGRFNLEGLPAGPGQLTAWHERSDPIQMPVTIGERPVALAPIDLIATVRQIAPQRERLRRRRRRRY